MSADVSLLNVLGNPAINPVSFDSLVVEFEENECCALMLSIDIPESVPFDVVAD